jgi:hypothetical protein
MIVVSLSMSETLSETTSVARRPVKIVKMVKMLRESALRPDGESE